MKSLSVLAALVIGVHALSLNSGLAPNKCITASSNTDGAAVKIGQCSGSSSQQWTYSGGGFRIFGNKCLDVPSGEDDDGVELQIWTCYDGNTNQQWRYKGDHIVWDGHGKCLDMTNGNTDDGNPVQIWSCSTPNPNQVWNSQNGGSGGPSAGASVSTVTVSATQTTTATRTVSTPRSTFTVSATKTITVTNTVTTTQAPPAVTTVFSCPQTNDAGQQLTDSQNLQVTVNGKPVSAVKCVYDPALRKRAGSGCLYSPATGTYISADGSSSSSGCPTTLAKQVIAVPATCPVLTATITATPSSNSITCPVSTSTITLGNVTITATGRIVTSTVGNVTITASASTISSNVTITGAPSICAISTRTVNATVTVTQSARATSASTISSNVTTTGTPSTCPISTRTVNATVTVTQPAPTASTTTYSCPKLNSAQQVLSSTQATQVTINGTLTNVVQCVYASALATKRDSNVGCYYSPTTGALVSGGSSGCPIRSHTHSFPCQCFDGDGYSNPARFHSYSSQPTGAIAPANGTTNGTFTNSTTVTFTQSASTANCTANSTSTVTVANTTITQAATTATVTAAPFHYACPTAGLGGEPLLNPPIGSQRLTKYSNPVSQGFRCLYNLTDGTTTSCLYINNGTLASLYNNSAQCPTALDQPAGFTTYSYTSWTTTTETTTQTNTATVTAAFFYWQCPATSVSNDTLTSQQDETTSGIVHSCTYAQRYGCSYTSTGQLTTAWGQDPGCPLSINKVNGIPTATVTIPPSTVTLPAATVTQPFYYWQCPPTATNGDGLTSSSDGNPFGQFDVGRGCVYKSNYTCFYSTNTGQLAGVGQVQSASCPQSIIKVNGVPTVTVTVH
ncbi:hypothetical protein D9758_001519 [Tetrapyrgos nigripes]|uniref:Ricin B lectin domain-containing protein n=1 Tax=Tetrapyrgos nigripes TaxID=182062 RepID=A0A8H5GY01_9AGAR|nr:hypothetical protein D9758_001519 [Tetrapyrgos nigripes]